MFWVAATAISGGFVAGVIHESIQDFRAIFFRKHPFLASVDAIYRAGFLLCALCVLYICASGLLLGHFLQRPFFTRILMFGLLMIGAGIVVLAGGWIAWALQHGPKMIAAALRERRFVDAAASVLLVALAAAGVALVPFFTWWIWAKR
jgi:hypothetical protein